MKNILSISILLSVLFSSCFVRYTYQAQEISDKEAEQYIKEMFYSCIPENCTDLQITPESIKATFNNSHVSLLFFNQIQYIGFSRQRGLEGRYFIGIVTRTSYFQFKCADESLSKNFLDAIEHFRKKL